MARYPRAVLTSWQALRRCVLPRTIWLAYLILYPLPWLEERPSRLDMALGAIGVAIFLRLYYWNPKTTRARLLQVAATAALAFALQPHKGAWTLFISYAAGFAIRIVPLRLALWVEAALMASIVAACPVLGFPWIEVAFSAFFSGFTAMATYSNIRLVTRNAELLAAQAEVRGLAAIAERERIARDLHDLLGHSLTMIAIKADLAERMLTRDPPRATAEIAEIGAAARDSLREVRAAVTGMKGASLAYEIERARAALSSAGLVLRVDGETAPITPARDGVLAMALREAVTNVIRHTRARTCVVTLHREGQEVVAMSIQDDGGAKALPVEGNGLRGMRARLAAAGGSLDVRTKSGGLCLTARLAPT